jgi:hypothetical protein
MSTTLIGSTMLAAVLTAASIGTISCGGERVGVGVGYAAGPPICPYGYYEAPPYNCAPDGYYGPEWFSGGVFIGAGPYYRGRDRFYGHVDHNLDFRHGYRGPTPQRGAPPAPNRAEFHGQAMHDPRGHEAPRGRR